MATEQFGRLFQDILDEVAGMDAIDVHTHLRWDKPQAQSAVPILFYHFVNFELRAAGFSAPDTHHERDVHVADVRDRITRALPWFPKIRFSGSYYCLKRILQDLYGMKTECPTEDFVDRLLGQIQEQKGDPSWAREVLLNRAHLKRASVNILNYERWPERMKQNDPDTHRFADIFFPAIEQGMFVFFPTKGILKTASERSGVAISDIDSFRQALISYLTPGEWDSIKSFLGWATIGIRFDSYSESLVATAIKKCLQGETTTAEEDNAVHVFCVRTLVEQLSPRGIPYQIFFGSEFVPPFREPAIAASMTHTILSFSSLARDFPDMNFELLLGTQAYSQDTNILVKNLPNVRVSGIWWHNMYPVYIRRLMEERLDICPLNKVSAFFSDAYCVEWAYGKRQLVQREFAHMCAEKVAKGYLSRTDVTEIARAWWYENPMNAYGLSEK